MPPIKLNRVAIESAQIYADALLEACAKAGVTDVLEALDEADRFPKLKAIDQVDFLIGWFTGAAEALGVTVAALWLTLRPAQIKVGNPKPARKPRQKAA